ncbi:hypothetical protein ACRJ4W_30585 [Streptomyces sp. GLT-R25]
MSGEPTFFEIGVADPERGRAFYGSLLGWTFEPGTSEGGGFCHHHRRSAGWNARRRRRSLPLPLLQGGRPRRRRRPGP